MLIFGLGYTATRIADALRRRGWQVDATGSAGNLAFGDDSAVGAALWRPLARPCRFEDAVDVLHQAFPKVERARIHKDVRALVVGLEKRGLLSTDSG